MVDLWKGPFDHIENGETLLCSQSVVMYEEQAGCDSNTQVLLEVESRNVICRGTVVDDRAVP